MSKRLLLCLSCALIAASSVERVYCATASSIEAYEHSPVGHIDIVAENLPPNASFDPKNVLNRLKTKVGDPFSQATFDADLKTLAAEYDRIEPIIEVHNGEVYITLKVWPRPAIRSIKWHGNEHIKTKTLQKELGIKPHAVFNRQSFNKAFNKLKEYYIKKGYFESQLQYKVVSDPKTNEVDISIEISEGRSGKIQDIVFKGFTSSEESELLGMIYTKKYNLFTSWLSGTGTYNEEALEQDKLTVINFLQNKGFADAKVSIQVLESKSEGKIILEITTERGQVFHFGKITFKGNVLFPDQEIDRRFLVRPGETYSPEKLRETVQAIKDLYGRKGYINCEVQYETTLVENAPVYNVAFVISEGEQYKIGMIHVLGNVNTQAHVILRESLLVPGETFDSAKLKATQTRLENIGYFKNVNVYAVRTQDDQALGENYRDVFIEVEETTTGNVSLFFGLSTADDLFGGLDLSESNFNYKGIPRIFKDGFSALRGGGEYAHVRATIGARQRSYSLSWLTPYFRDTLWRIGFDVTKSHSTLISKDYDVDTLGGSLYASYPLTPYWTFGTKYRVRNSTTHVSHDLDQAERHEVNASGLISAVGASISFDNADSSTKPHNGFRSLLDAEFAGVGGDFTFARFGYINTYYTQLWRRGIMKYRWEFRFIEPLGNTHSIDDIPLSERFFLGGENTVRGYKSFDLGPRFPNGDPTGGISSNLLSIEYLQEIFSFLDAFLFIDAGSISQKRFQLGHFNCSYGFGARVELINRVPVTVGMGFPVNPDNHNQIRKFFFSMGGQF
jgi:outer membrane protein insertion porin family